MDDGGLLPPLLLRCTCAAAACGCPPDDVGAPSAGKSSLAMLMLPCPAVAMRYRLLACCCCCWSSCCCRSAAARPSPPPAAPKPLGVADPDDGPDEPPTAPPPPGPPPPSVGKSLDRSNDEAPPDTTALAAVCAGVDPPLLPDRLRFIGCDPPPPIKSSPPLLAPNMLRALESNIYKVSFRLSRYLLLYLFLWAATVLQTYLPTEESSQPEVREDIGQRLNARNVAPRAQLHRTRTDMHRWASNTRLIRLMRSYLVCQYRLGHVSSSLKTEEADRGQKGVGS